MSLYLPLFLEPAPGDAQINYTSQDFRLMVSALAPQQGTIKAGDLKVTQRGAGANMSVDVAAGRAIIQGDTIANEGNYIVRSDAVYNVPLAAADTSNPRIDLIVAQVYNKQVDGGTQYAWVPVALKGTPAASPVAPNVPNTALLLAQVYVPANATSVTTTNTGSTVGYITDQRVLSGVGGGDVPQWDYSGTTGQSIPDNTDTVYTPSLLFRNIGMGTTATVGEVVCITPGRYQINFGTTFPAGMAAGSKNVGIRHYRSDGTTLVRTAFNTTSVTDLASLSVAQDFNLTAGDRVRATIYQHSGATITTTDTAKTNLFTGVWLGP